ncbi:MAG: AMP-binding protein [Clostridia bacterium]|nr:AMP-binding protein [Clostridia bacterium]
MKENSKNYLEITDLKDMLNKTKALYKNNVAYKLRESEGKYKEINHEEVRNTVDYLGTALINMGLKDKRIAIIGENRYEWEIAYLSIVCGTGIVVPLDKSLPENELELVIERSEVEAIFFSKKYMQSLEKIKRLGVGKLKHLICMDLDIHESGIYSQKELIQNGKKLLEEGDQSFVTSIINPEEMSIMLFTSGTTSMSKIVALSHKNICTNLMDLYKTLPIDSTDVFLSILPIHHVFECTVGFLSALYSGAQTVFCDGIRHIPENLKEYKVSVMACVPGIYEGLFKIIRKGMDKSGKLEEILGNEEKYKDSTMEERKIAFKDIHDMLGGNIKLFISGAASLDPKIENKYRLLGFNLVQGYGLTETSPVIGIGSNENYRLGSIGKALPSVEVKLIDVNKDGVGELVARGSSIMLEYYGNKKATKEALQDGWFYTGDLAKVDEDGYIFICGRKKSVIVLKNGKNIFPEEMENLVNKIEGVKESLIFGKQTSDDKDDIKINVKIIFDRDIVKDAYKVETEEEIQKVLHEKIKELNKTMPKYKAIRGVLFSERPLIKTSTNKIKRQANIDEIEKSKN